MKRVVASLLAFCLPAGAEAQTAPRGSVAPANMHAVAPALASYTDEVLFGDVWLRPNLSPRDRSLVVVAALVSGGNTEQLRGHLGRALDNGVKPVELSEAVTQLAFYAGWPKAVSAVNVMVEVFEQRGIRLAQAPQPTSPSGGLQIQRSGSRPPQRGRSRTSPVKSRFRAPSRPSHLAAPAEPQCASKPAPEPLGTPIRLARR